MTLEDLQNPLHYLEIQDPGDPAQGIVRKHYQIQAPFRQPDGSWSFRLAGFEEVFVPGTNGFPLADRFKQMLASGTDIPLFCNGRQIGIVRSGPGRLEYDSLLGCRFLVRYSLSPPVVNVGYLDPHEEHVVEAADRDEVLKWFRDNIQRDNPMARIIRVEPIE